MMGSVLPWNPEIRIEMGDKTTHRGTPAEHAPQQHKRARVGECAGSAQPEAISEYRAAHAKRQADE